jgi:hypothetical protein
MVGVGGGEVVLRITGVQKTKKRRRRKSCLWTGLIHRGEESTKSGYKRRKMYKKPLPVDRALMKNDMSQLFNINYYCVICLW